MKGLKIKGYYTKVENKILDLLPLLKLTKRELEFMIVAVRLLNGFDNEKDRIPLSQFAILTRMSKANCSRTVKSLIKKKMWYKSDNLIGINKDFSQWAGVANLATYEGLPKWHTGVAKIGKKKVANLDPSKETTKETIPNKGNLYIKLERKEINKLEKDPWYRAIMWNVGRFDKEYIEKTIKDYNFHIRMDSWYIFKDVNNVKNKEAYFSYLLENQ